MRKMLILLWTFLLLLCSISLLIAGDGKLIKVHLSNKSQQDINKFLNLHPDIAAYDKKTNSFDVVIKDEDLALIQGMNFITEIKIENLKKYDVELRNSGYFEHFHNYERMLDELQAVAQTFPDIAKLFDIGDSWEKTQGIANRDIWAIKISDNVATEEDEPEILIMGCHHAREIITPEIVLAYLSLLVNGYGTDPYLTYLINHRQIWLVPNVNPDGHTYVFNVYSMWRKNRRNNGDGSFGVDLNRNYSYQWGLFDNYYVSSNPGDECYRGPAPFSEPETKAIQQLVQSHQFIISISFHSYAEEVIYPWGYIKEYTPDHHIFTSIADSMVAYNNYGHGTSWESLGSYYLINGDSDDWFYGEQTLKNRVYGLTVEVGTSFHPDTAEIPIQISENIGPLKYITYAAGEEPIIEHVPIIETEDHGPYSIIAWIKAPILLTIPVPLDPTSYKLFYNTTGVAPFDSVSLQPTGNPDEYFAEIPTIPAATKIYYYLNASDQNGRTGRMPKGAPVATYSFNIGADLEAPKIEPTPLAYASAFATQYSISAYVTDNIGISSVKLFHLKKGGTTDTLNMKLTSAPNLYQGIIVPENIMIGDTIKYQILAIDNSNNKNTTLMPATGFFQFYLKNSIIYDFELEQTLQPINGGDWQWGRPTSGPNNAHSGVQVWATNLNGNYSNLTESILETPEINLAEKDSAKLIFWHWYQNEYSENTFWDGGNIKISVDKGDCQIIKPADGYDGVIDPFNTFLGGEPCFGGPAANGNFWHQEIIDLTPYANHAMKIRFHFGTDQAVNDFGWYIDDVEIEFKQPTALVDNDAGVALPLAFELKQNYPNPFNPETRIQYQLAQAGEVRLEIYNLLGKKVITLVNERQSAGFYSLIWNGKDLLGNDVASGVYLCRLAVKDKNFNYSISRKMVKLQ